MLKNWYETEGEFYQVSYLEGMLHACFWLNRGIVFCQIFFDWDWD
jgi:hypothetical protein